MKLSISFLLLIFNCSITYSQNFYLYGDKTFGGNKREAEGTIISLVNGDLIIGGKSFTDTSGDKNVTLCDSMVNQSDLWLLKIDTAFNIIWQKDIGGNATEGRPYIRGTNSLNEILFASVSSSDSSCDKSEKNRSYPLSIDDYWIGKMDQNGTTQFEKTFGSTNTERGCKIIELTNGELIIAGGSADGISADKSIMNFGMYDCWLVKTDSLGNKIWDKVYGGTDTESTANFEFDILPLSGGSFLLSVATNSPVSGNITELPRGFYDYWIIKIDNNGNPLWDKRFGGSNNDVIYHIEPTFDNGFILSGSSNSRQGLDVSQAGYGQYDYWLVKIDSLGNKMWDKRYGGTGWESGYWIEQDYDGGYWIGGATTSDISGDVSEISYGGSDYWLIKIDSLGNKLFDKRFGGPGTDVLYSFLILPDSSLMLFGTADSGISSIKTDAGKGLADFWLVHFYYGNTPPVSINEIQNAELISIFPNPASDAISFSENNNFAIEKILFYDVAGRMVFEKLVDKSTSVDIGFLSPALYFYEMRSINGEIAYGKLLKQ